MLNLSFFWQKFQNKNMVQQRRTMEGKIDSMTAKEKYHKRSDFCYSCNWKFEQEICFSCWQSQVLFKELDLFYSWICGSKLIPDPFQFFLERVRNELAAGLLNFAKEAWVPREYFYWKMFLMVPPEYFSW